MIYTAIKVRRYLAAVKVS